MYARINVIAYTKIALQFLCSFIAYLNIFPIKYISLSPFSRHQITVPLRRKSAGGVDANLHPFESSDLNGMSRFSLGYLCPQGNDDAHCTLQEAGSLPRDDVNAIPKGNIYVPSQSMKPNVFTEFTIFPQLIALFPYY